jgi:hypothetical protein
MASTRPVIAAQCPKPQPLERSGRPVPNSALLRREIQEAGGLEAWLRTRLGRWLERTEPDPRCPVILPQRPRS